MFATRLRELLRAVEYYTPLFKARDPRRNKLLVIMELDETPEARAFVNALPECGLYNIVPEILVELERCLSREPERPLESLAGVLNRLLRELRILRESSRIQAEIIQRLRQAGTRAQTFLEPQWPGE